ncbi:MAG: hypothetical protein IT454_20015 [Planctomycetes bacterium]|nr:hypothetical protein [Planctomycetota bacterium]
MIDANKDPIPRINRAAFFRDIGYKPHPGQRAVHASKKRYRVVACGSRWGKSVCAAMETLASAFEPRECAMIWVVAPTYDLADRIYRQIELKVLERLPHRLIAKKEAERRILLRNLAGGVSEIRAKSADNPDSLLGEGLDFLVVDEASRLRPRIWNSFLSQRLMDKRGSALLISTPRSKGYFYDLYRRGQPPDPDPDYASWNMPSWSNPMLPMADIEAERRRLPDAAFRQELGAEFIEGAGAVFHGIRDIAVGEFQEPVAGERYVAGLDLAKVQDYTVLIIINSRREVVFYDRFHRLDWGLQTARIVGATSRYQRAQILCDVTGVGDPIYEELCRAGCRVTPYAFTSRSKSALVENLVVMCEQRRLVLPRAELWPEGIEELEDFQYSVTDAGTVRSGAPSGQHDDIVMALGLAAWQVRAERPQYRISTVRRRDPHIEALRQRLWR